MAGDRSVVLFEAFDRGEFGQAVPIETGRSVRGGSAGSVATSGMWTGMNMMVLPDRSLCPQPSPKAQATTFPALAGAIVDIGMGSNGSAQVLWIKAGNTIYQSGAGPTYSFAALTGTSANALSYFDRVAVGTKTTYALTSAGVLEVIDHLAGTIAAVAGSPPAAATVCPYGDRLMLGAATGLTPNRLYFSAAGNFASWPATNFIDVGDGSPIVALMVMRGVLMIVKRGPSEDTWWTLRGVPGVNAILRRSSRFQGPARPNNLALTSDNRLAFGVPTANNANNGVVAPATFDGTTGRKDVAQIGLLSDAAVTEAYRLTDGSDVIIKNGLYALIRRAGAWTRFTIPSLLQPNTTNFGITSRTMAVDPTAGTFYMVNFAGTAIASWKPYAVRPAFAADTDGAPPDDAPFFTLPEWRSASGDDVCVVAVVVAFKKWGTGAGVPNSFAVTSTATGTYAAGLSVASSTVGTFSEAAASSSVDGTLARATFTFAPVWGNGFTLVFSNLVGVAIRSVTVTLETKPMPGVS